jgi:hypothetical protein
LFCLSAGSGAWTGTFDFAAPRGIERVWELFMSVLGYLSKDSTVRPAPVPKKVPAPIPVYKDVKDYDPVLQGHCRL